MPSKIAKKLSVGKKKKKDYGVMKKIKKYGPGVAAAALALGTTAAGTYAAYTGLNPENPNPMAKKGADWKPNGNDDDPSIFDLQPSEGMLARVKESFERQDADDLALEAETQAEMRANLYPERPIPIPNPYLYHPPSPLTSKGLPIIRDSGTFFKIRQRDYY